MPLFADNQFTVDKLLALSPPVKPGDPTEWGVEARRRALFPDVSEAEWNDWRWQMRRALTSLDAVIAYGKVPESERAALARVVEKYPVIISPYTFVSLISKIPKTRSVSNRFRSVKKPSGSIWVNPIPWKKRKTCRSRASFTGIRTAC